MEEVDKVESFFNIPAIQQEFAAIKAGLAESQKGLSDLYAVVKSFKDTSITNLAENTEKLSQAINGSVQSTARAKQSFEDLTQKISAQVKAVNENITSIKDNSQAYDQLIKQAVRNKIANDDLTASAAALKKSYESGAASMEQYSEGLASIKDAQQSLKISNQGITQSINNMERQSQAANGSLNQLRATLNSLTANFDALDEAERNSEGGKKLLQTIEQVHAKVMELEFATGRPGRNVGNYLGSLAPAFETLKEELVQVNAELAQMEKAKAHVQNVSTVGFKTAAQRQSEGLTDQTGSGPTNFAGGNPIGFDPERYKELIGQRQALNVVIGQSEKTFSSVTMATRASERALQTMAAAGLEGTEGFEKLREATIEASQAQKEFTRQQKLLESEAPVLGAITLAAKGLAGAYAVGAGSVALFAEGNEKVEKELNKLVAIMTILQGLDEAYELINKSGAASQAIRNALMKATSGMVKETTVSTEAATAANVELAATETELAAVEPAVAEGAEAQTAAMTEMTVATEGATAATEGATVATVTLGRALAMTGIGAAIAVVAVAIAYVISKIPDWIRGNDISIKQQGEMTEAIKKANDALVEQAKSITNLDDVSKKYYEKLLSQATAAGENEYTQFAIRKQINAQEKQLAQDQIDLLGATNEQQSNLKSTLDGLNDKRREAIRIQQQILAIPEQHQTRDQKDQLEAATKNADMYGKQIESINGLYEAGQKARGDLFEANKKDGDEEIAIAKLSADEQRKLIFETGKLQVDAAKDRNSKIMADARSTSAQRLAAIKSDRDQEVKAAQLDRNNLDPHATDAQVTEANNKLNAAKDQANRDFNEKTREENRKEYERNRDAALDAYKTQLNDQIQAAQDLQAGKNQNNPNPLQRPPKVSLGERLKGLSEEYAARRNLLNAQLNEDVDKEGQNAEEKKAIYSKYDSDILGLYRNFQMTYADLEEEARQQSLREWDMYYSKRQEQIDENTNDQLVGLNMSHEGNKKYGRDKTAIEDEGAIKTAKRTVDQAETDRNSTQDGTQARIDANDKLSKSAEDLSEKIRKQRQDGIDSSRDEAADDIQELQMVGDAGFKIAEIGYNRQLADLQNLEKRQARSYELQAKQIQDTTGSQEQKALRMKVLDDQKAAQDEKNARKQKQLDIEKAKFDKDKAIMDIILGTAVSVTKALDDPYLAIAIAIAGAAELAVAVATPLPKYKAGIGIGNGEHLGGKAVVGDGGEPELIHEPGKAPRWSASTPTIESLLPYTKVIPASRIEEMVMSGMFVNQRGVLVQQENRHLEKKIDRLTETIIWQTQRLEKAASNNRPRVINNIKLDAKFGEHIYKSVFK